MEQEQSGITFTASDDDSDREVESSDYQYLTGYSRDDLVDFNRLIQEEADSRGLVVIYAVGSPVGVGFSICAPDWFLLGGRCEADAHPTEIELGPCRLPDRFFNEKAAHECMMTTMNVCQEFARYFEHISGELKGMIARTPFATIQDLREARPHLEAQKENHEQVETPAVQPHQQAS